MSRSDENHWDRVWAARSPSEQTWFQSSLLVSLGFIDDLGLSTSASIVDVGGGASTLVDDLLARGYADVTVLDVSGAALDAARSRLGARAEPVTWLAGDVTELELPPQRYDVWHDRAVFHFLTAPGDRRKYVALAAEALKPGGHVVMVTFGPGGPDRCSGLSVVRYDPRGLQAELGSQFVLVGDAVEAHTTPTGREQEFVYSCFRFDPR